MKIFILEDYSERVKVFFELFNSHSIVLSNNAFDAKEILIKNKFSLIFLDHDLDNRVYVNSEEENTGYQVAKLLNTTINSSTPVIVHSWNQTGAKNMLKVLNEKAKHIPFGLFDEKILSEF